jgi:hypothetical protein
VCKEKPHKSTLHLAGSLQPSQPCSPTLQDSKVVQPACGLAPHVPQAHPQPSFNPPSIGGGNGAKGEVWAAPCLPAALQFGVPGCPRGGHACEYDGDPMGTAWDLQGTARGSWGQGLGTSLWLESHLGWGGLARKFFWIRVPKT